MFGFRNHDSLPRKAAFGYFDSLSQHAFLQIDFFWFRFFQDWNFFLSLLYINILISKFKEKSNSETKTIPEELAPGHWKSAQRPYSNTVCMHCIIKAKLAMLEYTQRENNKARFSPALKTTRPGLVRPWKQRGQVLLGLEKTNSCQELVS